ncbi:MAG TPA: hypothetical protein VMA53_20705 [Stellaceae bacterium]|nr:hypothetical protein [Stellaceae bacterium]
MAAISGMGQSVPAISEELSRQIAAAHLRLNSDAVLPSLAHRRNHAVYALVCYVNNIIGCYLSKNFGPIPLFVQRARDHMSASPADSGSANYYVEAAAYLDLMEAALSCYDSK